MADFVQFYGFLDITSTFKEKLTYLYNKQKICYLIVPNEWTWSHWKLLAITHYLANRAENFYGNSGDYYLSKEFWFWGLIDIFDFLATQGLRP